MNRRRGPSLRRLFRKPDLGALIGTLGGALKRVRLPALSHRNRKKLVLFSKSAAVDDPRAADVAPTRPNRSPRPRSVLRMVLGFVAFAAPLAAALVAFTVPLIGVRAYEYVMQSGYFHVREVVVDDVVAPGGEARTPHLGRDEVLKLAGIDAGTHVLDADVDGMSARLTANPWIRWARVERELPDRLVIHLVEHHPAAYLAADNLYVIDELGVPFALAPADLTLTLPVISGIAAERLADPKEAPAIEETLASALNVLRIWEAQGLSHRYPVGELRLEGGGGVAVVLEGKTAGSATEIVLGRGPFREKLFRVEWVLEHLRSLGKTAEYILLDLGDDLAPGATGATEMGGARVVVKTDLGAESIEAPQPAHSEQAVPVPPAHPPAPSQDIPESHEPDADLEGAEAAPISGGRPANDDDGQE